MKRLSFLVAFGLMSLPLVSHALLWDFNDENQLDDWIVIVGTTENDEEALKISNPSAEGLVLTGQPEWSDYTIECKARMTEPAGFNNVSIVFRASDDASDEYILMLEGGRQQAEWWKKIAGGYTEIQSDALDIELEDWFTFKAVVEGNKFQCYYNGEFVSEIEDEDLEKGMVGVRVYGCTSHVDDFDVNGPGIPLTSVDAAGKIAATWGCLKKL